MMEEPIDLAQYATEKGNPWFGLGNLISGLFDVESRADGMVIDESGQEHKVYRHVFTPPGMTEVGTSRTLPLLDIQALQEQMFTMAQAEPAFLIHPKRVHWLTRMYATSRRYARWQKIRKRQRRHAQRRRNRGGA